MKTKLTITIKKRSQTGWLVWLLVMLPMFFGTLNDLLGLPWAIRYLMDVSWCALLFMMLYYRCLDTKWLAGPIAWILLFLTCTVLVYLVQYQSALYFLWGVRNNFRFYAAFFAFVTFLMPRDTEDYFRIFDGLFWVNAVVSLFQYLFLGLKQDNLGGIFGTESGCNAYTNIFILIVTTRSILRYLEKKEKAGTVVAKFATALLVAALAELKFFFVELFAVLALAVLFTDFTWRKLGLIVGGVSAIICGAALLTVVFPNFAGWLSWEWLIEAASSDKGYTSSGDLNRLNAIPVINERWLKTGAERLFGLGLGNCDTSTFDMLNTPFFKANSTSHYTWLSYAFMYLECGWVGLMFYFGFFILVYFRIRKIEKRSCGEAVTYCRLGRIMALMCMLISVYNSSLRTEAGYMAYFVLALPFALGKRKMSPKGEELSC